MISDDKGRRIDAKDVVRMMQKALQKLEWLLY
jgi:hypothetical protein